ncbi:unnamed protein product [Camellia sinensis]
MDGCKKVGGEDGFGGLLRDERGVWICRYDGRLHTVTSVEAELWALYKRLTVILQKGMNKVIIKIDAAQVMQLMKEELAKNTPFKILVEGAKILLRG